jgi:gentisate 1,2-dioxygenase
MRVARRRHHSIRRSQIQLQRSSHRGVYIGEIVNPALSSESHLLAAEIQHLPPGVHTNRHRHAERVVHVMSGSGYSIIDGDR